MAEFNQEQVKTFFTNLGLEETDFTKISTEEVTDFEPFISKIKGGITESLKSDTTFLDEITKPFKDAPIGKENQLKKIVRKTFGLTHLSEDELKKMPFEELANKAKEVIAGNSTSNNTELQTKLSDYMERYEALETDLPTKVNEAVEKERATWQAKFDSMTIREEVAQLVAVESQGVKKENIPNFTTAFLGFVQQSGYKITIDAKKNMKLTDFDGNPAQLNGTLLRVKDFLKTFGETVMNMNVAPRGGATDNQQLSIGNKDLLALELMGKGFAK
jgi:hypothetical protein